MKTMNSLIAVVTVLGASSAFAQTYVAQAQQEPTASAAPQAVVKKRTMIYDERSNELVEVQPQTAAEVAPAPAAAAPAPAQSPIYILNNQKYQGYQGTEAQARVQDQPTTVVQDTPLKTSPADGMRKKRQETESATEDGIVQALEKARMDDEIRRRDRFNNAIGSGEAAPAPSPTPTAAAPAPVQQVQQIQTVNPPPAVVEEPAQKTQDDEEKVDIRNEIRTAIAESKLENKDKNQMYVSGLVGMGKYPDAVNVRGNIATGVAVGVVTPERVVAEGSFTYSTYQIEDTQDSVYYLGSNNAILVDMNQYSFDAALKYQILPGRLRPVVGVVAEYTRRQTSLNGTELQTSDALNGGATAGLDVQLTENFGIGFDFRYLMNISYRLNSDTGSNQSFVYGRRMKQVEELDYYTAMLTGRLSF